jgi:hypothetical protein
MAEVLQSKRAVDDVVEDRVSRVYPPGFGKLPVDDAISVRTHISALTIAEAILRADERAGTSNLPAHRQWLLLRSALADRTVHGLGEVASDGAQIQARDFAQALLDWDRDHSSHTGAVSASDPRWAVTLPGYVRQEFRVHMAR